MRDDRTDAAELTRGGVEGCGRQRPMIEVDFSGRPGRLGDERGVVDNDLGVLRYD